VVFEHPVQLLPPIEVCLRGISTAQTHRTQGPTSSSLKPCHASARFHLATYQLLRNPILLPTSVRTNPLRGSGEMGTLPHLRSDMGGVSGSQGSV
jgi:hypothetical protein